MTTYAHIVNGFVTDVARTPPALEDQFHPDWLAQNAFYVAPDDTVPGRAAVINPDNSVTWGANPPPPQPPAPVPTTLSATGFQDLCETGFGGGSTGATRFGTVMRAMESSGDDLIFSIYQRFFKSITFDKSKAGPLFAVLVSKGIMTTAERTAILNNWPTA